MDKTQDERRQRLHGLLDLARSSRGWSRAQLGRALGRDPTKVYSSSGNPKSDFVVKLADVLGWPVGAVLEAIWTGEGVPASENGSAGSSGATAPADATNGEPAAAEPDAAYRSLYAEAREAHAAGRFADVVERAQEMGRIAPTPERRAFASAMEYSGWDGLGRHTQAVDAARRGLACTPVSATTRNILRADLANAWYALWDLTPALGTAQVLADWYAANPPERRVDHKRPAFVLYVRGNTRRRLAMTEPDLADQHARGAVDDLARAAEMYRELAGDLGDDSLAGIANTCDGGRLEAETMLGLRDPADAVAELLGGVGRATLSGGHEGDWLESYGWWCVFGSNIALRSLAGADLQRAVQTLTDAALTIAERLDNWSMRERAYSLQFALHRRLGEMSGLDFDLTIGESDRGRIAGAMGRFPRFRPVGWHMLTSAKVVTS